MVAHSRRLQRLKKKDPVHGVIEETLEDMLLSSDNDDPI